MWTSPTSPTAGRTGLPSAPSFTTSSHRSLYWFHNDWSLDGDCGNFLFRWSSIGDGSDGDYKWQCWWQLKMHLIFDNLVKWSCFPGFWLHQADKGEQKTKLRTRLPDWRVSFSVSHLYSNLFTQDCMNISFKIRRKGESMKHWNSLSSF